MAIRLLYDELNIHQSNELYSNEIELSITHAFVEA